MAKELVARKKPQKVARIILVKQYTKQTRPRSRISFVRKRIPRGWIFLSCLIALLLPAYFFSQPGDDPTTVYYAEGGPAGGLEPPPGKPVAADDQVSATNSGTAATRRPNGVTKFQGVDTPYILIRPILDNRRDFGKYFPKAMYSGDIGDPDHQNAKEPLDHTPGSISTYKGLRHKRGYIYAQDLGGKDQSDFNQTHFVRWLCKQVRAGKYPEIKYITSRRPENRGTNCYGVMSRKNNWKPIAGKKHETHVHISYMMSYNGMDIENMESKIIEDYARSIGRA